MKKQNENQSKTSRYLAAKVLEEFLSIPGINIAQLSVFFNMPEFLNKILNKIETILDEGFKKDDAIVGKSVLIKKIKKRKKRRKTKNLLPALSKKSKIGTV